MTITKRNECTSSAVDNTLIVGNSIDNSIHFLNETATIVWNLIDGGSFDNLLRQLISLFPNECPETLQSDLEELINEMKDKGLVLVESQK